MVTATNLLPVTQQVAADLLKLIDRSPVAFEVMVYKAKYDDHEQVTVQPDLVGNLEAREKKISFSEPVISKALMLPNEQTGLTMLAPGFDSIDSMEEPIMVVLKEPDVPEQSILWYEQQVEDDRTIVTLLYVLRSEPIGINGQSGSVHVLMPFSQSVGALPDGNIDFTDNHVSHMANMMSDSEELEQPDNAASDSFSSMVQVLGDVVEEPASESLEPLSDLFKEYGISHE